MLTKKMKRILRNHLKNFDVRPAKEVHYQIMANQYYREQLDKFWADGKIGVHRSGMDCDCTQYYHTTIIEVPNSAVALRMNEVKHQSYLDGIESSRFDAPTIKLVHTSRDLAMEAFEDGHAHIVYY